MERKELILRESMKRYPDSPERGFGHGDYECPESHEDEREAFIAGAEWADANTEWIRPVDEMPPIGVDVLTRVKRGSGDVIYQVDRRSEYEWTNLCHYDRVTHWKNILFSEE